MSIVLPMPFLPIELQMVPSALKVTLNWGLPGANVQVSTLLTRAHVAAFAEPLSTVKTQAPNTRIDFFISTSGPLCGE
jgi:hypothetical protein